MVGFVEKSGQLVEQVSKDQEQAKQAAPEAVDLLVKKALLSEDQRDRAIESIGTKHATTIEILRRAATHIGAEKSAAVASMGVPAGDPTGAGDVEAPIEAANRRFLAAIGY